MLVVRNVQSDVNMQYAYSIERGLPSHDFFDTAWGDEPLTNVLKETNIPIALPLPDEDVSLIAKNEQKVIGQCSTNRVVKYWNL